MVLGAHCPACRQQVTLCVLVRRIGFGLRSRYARPAICGTFAMRYFVIHDLTPFMSRHAFVYNHQALETDLLNPDRASELRKHKLKRLVQSPNSYFMDVKCPGCYVITTVFSHAQTVVVCGDCTMVLCQPTGGKARLTEGCSFRKKVD